MPYICHNAVQSIEVLQQLAPLFCETTQLPDVLILTEEKKIPVLRVEVSRLGLGLDRLQAPKRSELGRKRTSSTELTT